MSAFEGRLVDEIDKRIKEEIDMHSDSLESAQDWADLKRRIGILNGLRLAMKIVRDAAKQANQ